MSFFGSLFSRIAGHAQAAAPPGDTASAVPSATAAPGDAASTAMGDAAAAGQATAMKGVDVEAILNGLAAKASQKLDWQHSIVDLMKLVGLDSSLDARKAMAAELKYGGSTSDSAAMNIWLHQQVMQKLAANGGKLPASLAGAPGNA